MIGEDGMYFHKADSTDINRLRTIAYHSEAHWGYDETFMGIFEERFNITEEFLSHNPVYAAAKGDETVGFWGMHSGEEGDELEYFYIAPSYLNQGLGKIMWHHLIAWCADQGIDAFTFVTSPQAAGFYEKMGAVIVGERRSVIDGRQIPLLKYNVDR